MYAEGGLCKVSIAVYATKASARDGEEKKKNERGGRAGFYEGSDDEREARPISEHVMMSTL